jgi:cellobiose phosphorylase
VEKGIRKLTVNGKEISGNLIPITEGVTKYEVDAVM